MGGWVATATLNEAKIRALGMKIAKKQLKQGAIAVSQQAKVNAPHITYRLENSIHPVLPGTTDTNFSYRDKEGNVFDGASGMTAKTNEAYVLSNVPYAIYPEEGTSDEPWRAWHYLFRALQGLGWSTKAWHSEGQK